MENPIHQKYAKDVIKHHAKSFYFASQFLPKNTRADTYGVYSFCRYCDNIVDNPRSRSENEIRDELNYLRQELRIAERTGESENPAIGAFIASAKRNEIPMQYAFELIEGVEMDLLPTGFETFDELYVFCYKVASVVGLMMSHVLGFEDKAALKYAEWLGIAMQLTNILRDVEEDAKMDRIYLPENELEKFKVKKEDIFRGRFNENFKNLMIYQIDRAKHYYKIAETGIEMLSKRSRFAIYASSKIYGKILDKLIARDYNPFNGRAFVSKPEKFRILFTELIGERLT